MSTELFIVKRNKKGLFKLPDGRLVQTWDTPPGAMWRCDCHGEQGWLIRLPGEMNAWCTLSRTASGPWEVSGEALKLTVKPSINVVGSWHGFITDGVMTPA